MYICKSEVKENTIIQTELSDYLGRERKIIFNLDNPSEARKAERILTPKANKKPRKSKKPKKRSTQMDIGNLIPKSSQSKILPSDFKKNRSKSNKKSSKTQKVLEKDSSSRPKMVKKKKLEKTEKLDQIETHTHTQKETNETSEVIKTSKKIIQSPVRKEIEFQEKKIKKTKKSINKEKPSINKEEPSPISLTQLNPSSFQTSKPGANKKEEKTHHNLPPILPEKELKPINQQIIPDIALEDIGYGGELEVSCPFCSEAIDFYMEDRDEHDLINTRQCICGAITRISIRNFNRNIFKDLNIDESKFKKIVKRVDNRIRDEFGNEIYTYGFINE